MCNKTFCSDLSPYLNGKGAELLKEHEIIICSFLPLITLLLHFTLYKKYNCFAVMSSYNNCQRAKEYKERWHIRHDVTGISGFVDVTNSYDGSWTLGWLINNFNDRDTFEVFVVNQH